MSGATLGMGLVPTYAQWGVAASALMVTLRLIQGFCLGGELPGALTYVVETAPRIAPFVCGVVFACVTMGVAAATGVSLSVRTFLDRRADVPTYGWRIAFVLGGLGGVLSFVLASIARRVAGVRADAEPGVTAAVPRTAEDASGARVVGCALLAGTGCFNGLFFSHLPAYLSTVLHYDPRQAVFSQTVGVIASSIGILVTGWLGDRIPPRHLLRVGVTLLLLLAYPFYSGARNSHAQSDAAAACWPASAPA